MARRRAYRLLPQQTVVASAARTTSSNSATLTGWARGAGAVAKLDVTAASGTTPSLTCTVQDSPDGTTWTTRDTFAAKTTTGTETRALPSGMNRFQRVAWVVTGTTPSFTFSVQFAASTAVLL